MVDSNNSFPPLLPRDRVRVLEGTFADFVGDVVSVDRTNDRVTLEITILEKPTPVECERRQLELVFRRP